MASGYEVNYNDERFSQIDADKKVALSDLEQTYAGMTAAADSFYNAQINAAQQWADKQSQLQQEQTDFAIAQIEQQKEQTHKDYIKEQSGAYTDWQKQSNKYGVNAEQQASAGVAGSGYAESSQVSMYNTYQNRVATAREVLNQAITSYNNDIAQARLQNSAALAQIAYEALVQQLELSLSGFQYKNQLILDKASQKTQIENNYHNRYLDVLDQINAENALAEEVRQYNALLEQEIKNATYSDGGGAGGNGDSNALILKEPENNQADNDINIDWQKLELPEKAPASVVAATQGIKNAVDPVGNVVNPVGTAAAAAAALGINNALNALTNPPEIDMRSVNALGLGSLSAAQLANLVSSGAIGMKQENGKLVFYIIDESIKDSFKPISEKGGAPFKKVTK